MGYTNTGSTACVSAGGTMISTVVSYSISRTNQSPGSGVTSKSRKGTKNVNGPRTWRAGCVARSMPSGLGPGESGEFRGCQGDSGVIQSGQVLCTTRFRRCAISAIMGAAPEPVPPPIPATMYTTS